MACRFCGKKPSGYFVKVGSGTEDGPTNVEMCEICKEAIEAIAAGKAKKESAMTE